METVKHSSVQFFIFTVFLVSCSSPLDEVKFCGDIHCSESKPWKVESLNLGIPCFATKEECLEWAKHNGYGNPTDHCILCN